MSSQNKISTNRLKEQVLTSLKASTAYGIPNLVNSKKIFGKIFWFFYLCISAVLSIWFINGTINDYLSYDVVTKIESVYEQPSKLPTVSFCSYSSQGFGNKSLQKLIKECWISLDSNCLKNPNKYFESYINENGKHCYRFNSGKNLTNHSIPFFYSTIGGKDDSFRFVIDEDNGLSIWIHDSFSPPRTQYLNNHDGNEILASTDFVTHLKVHKIVEKSLGKPYNQCFKNVSDFEFNKTIINYIEMKGEDYKQSNCFEICFDLDYIENNPCNCSNSTIGNVWSECFIKYLNNDDISQKISNCTSDYKKRFYKNPLTEKCKQYCPLECDSISYSVTNNPFTTKQRQGKKEIIFFVFFKSLKYTLITQQPKMQVFDLISNIGGTFGLFIGFSFVTLFEIGEIFLEILFNFFNSNVIHVNSAN